MRISDQWKENGYRSCEDIVKVSVTSHLIFFDSLELLIISELARANMADRISQEVVAWTAVNFLVRIFLQADTDSQQSYANLYTP
jgi:hypothetical protein